VLSIPRPIVAWRRSAAAGAPQLYFGSGITDVGAIVLVRRLIDGPGAARLALDVGVLSLGLLLVADGLRRAWRRRRFEAVTAGLAREKAVASPNRAVLTKVIRRLVAGATFGTVCDLAAYLIHAESLTGAVAISLIPALQYLTSGDQDTEPARAADGSAA